MNIFLLVQDKGLKTQVVWLLCEMGGREGGRERGRDGGKKKNQIFK